MTIQRWKIAYPTDRSTSTNTTHTIQQAIDGVTGAHQLLQPPAIEADIEETSLIELVHERRPPYITLKGRVFVGVDARLRRGPQSSVVWVVFGWIGPCQCASHPTRCVERLIGWIAPRSTSVAHAFPWPIPPITHKRHNARK